MENFRESLQKGLIVLIRAYQYGFASLLGPCCRFEPHCSEYAIQAIKKFGIMKGLWITAFRLLRCHRWHPGGPDPVPFK